MSASSWTPVENRRRGSTPAFLRSQGTQLNRIFGVSSLEELDATDHLTNLPLDKHTDWLVRRRYEGCSSSRKPGLSRTLCGARGREHEYPPDHHADRVLRRRHRLRLAEHRHLRAPARQMAPPALASPNNRPARGYDCCAEGRLIVAPRPDKSSA